GGGGAIYNAGRMMLISCALEHNTAGSGGAGYNYFSTFGSFHGGEPGGAGGDGGAICDAGQTTTLFDCQFRFNASGAGGMGTAEMPFSQPALGGSGGAGGGGGAIWAGGSVRINGCTFLSNQTGSGGAGGRGRQAGGA